MQAIDSIYDFEICQEEGGVDGVSWYIYDHNENEVFRNEWFGTQEQAQDYLDAFNIETGRDS